MDTVNVRLLDIENWRIIKIIRLEKQYGSRYMWADLIYTRRQTKEYGVKISNKSTEDGLFYDIEKTFTDDYFDELVLKAVRTRYPDAFLQSCDVITDSDVKRMEKLYSSYIKDSGIIYLNPTGIDYNTMRRGTIFCQFNIPLEIFIPCEEFRMYFHDEGFFDNYDITKVEEVKELLDEKKASFQGLSDYLKYIYNDLHDDAGTVFE